MKKVIFCIKTLALLFGSSSLVYAHSQMLASGSHLVEHLTQCLILSLVILLVARIIWLKRHSDS